MINFQINKRSCLFLFLLVLVLTFFAYYPGLFGDYVFDDFPNIINNKKLQLDNLNKDSLLSAAFSSDSGALKRPISMVSFALNGYFFGIQPFSYKVFNLIIHLTCGIFIFLVTRIIIQCYQRHHKPDYPDTAVLWLPLIISTVWLLHPINLTSVLYIVQRMTSLASLFVLVGLYFYTLGRSRTLAHKPGFHLALIGLFVFLPLATLSKESGILLPLYMFVIEITIFQFKNTHGDIDKKVVGIFIISLLLPVIGLLALLSFYPGYLIGGYEIRGFTLTERLLTEARVILFYIKLILFPSLSELGLYHDDIELSRSLFEPFSTFLSIITIIGLLFAGLSMVKKQPLISLGILWFFAGHTLESTIIPLEIAHEHRNYLPGYGILLSVFTIFSYPFFHRISKPLLISITLVYVSLILIITHMRALQWQSNIEHALLEAENHPMSARAVYSAGRICTYMTLSAHVDKTEMAYDYLEKARKLDKYGILSNVSLIIFSYRINRPIKPEWLDDTRHKLQNYPIIATTRTSMKTLVKCQGGKCRLSDDEIESLFQSALQNIHTIKSGVQDAYILSVYAEYTVNHKKNYSKGLELNKRAIKSAPHEPQYRVNYIKLLILTRHFDEAKYQIKELIRLDRLGVYKKFIKTIKHNLSTISK